ncbi:MATE family efflux transporter [Rhodospirillaceae bacterium SYSU D60014]|uniref:MATE family efflux transporter n=1 Tax=Virgifigura deserti TaxID=2268457 RepID=UPI000E664197
MQATDLSNGPTRASAGMPTPQAELRATLRITGPLAAAYLAEMAMSFTDTVIVGRLGSVELAAVGLAANLLISLLLICMGVVSIVGVFVAQAHGAGDGAAVGRSVRQGLWVATALSIPATWLGWNLAPVLRLLGQDEQVVLLAEQYLQAAVWCFLPYMWFTVLRNFVSALSLAGSVMVISVASVGLNLLANYSLVFGKFGLPALGVAGAGYGTSFVCWVMFGALAAHVALSPVFRGYHLFSGLGRIDGAQCREILRLGLPVAGVTAAEVGMFSAVTVLMGVLGATVLAASQIAIVSASVAFMIPAAISQAATYRVAHGIGIGSAAAARQAGYLSILLTVAFMAVVSIVMWVFPDAIAGIYLDTEDPANAEVLALAAILLGITAIFQIADGVQVSVTGALRGLKDTTVPFLAGLTGYWIVGLGSGYVLAFPLGLGGPGLFWGLALGLVTVAALLTWRFRSRTAFLMRSVAGATPTPA